MNFFLFISLLTGIIQPKTSLLEVPIETQNLNILKSADFVPVALMDNMVIVEALPSGINRLEQAGVSYKTLLEPESFRQAKDNRSFYFVFPPFRKKSEEAKRFLEANGQILSEGENCYLYLTTQEFAQTLPQLRYEITYISLKPIVLPEIAFSDFLPKEPTKLEYNRVIDNIISQITPTELAQLLRELSGEVPVVVWGNLDTIRTRYATAPRNSVAIRYWYEKLLAFSGLDSVTFHPFIWESSHCDSNIIATKLGTTYPNQYYIIGGHIDNTSEIPNTYAPGADDNGTGSVAMLIAAKYLNTIPFKYTIRFIAWNAEEFGLYGSQAHAQEAHNRGDSILGVLNGDMIGTETINRDSLEIYTGSRPGSRALGDTFYSVNATYGLGLHIRRSTQMPQYSDHYPYYAQGYNSNCIIEADFCPYYHRTQDRITASSFDTIFFTKVVKGMVATLATLAQPDTLYKDIAVIEIIQPVGTIDSNTVVVPQAKVKNYGFNSETFSVTFRIGDFYNETRNKTLNPGQIDTVNFPAWLATQIGTHTTKCTTQLVGDMKQSNDYLINSVTVAPVGIAENSEPTVHFEDSKPNPFLTQTIIHYSLPSQAKVSLEIYNVVGNLVRTLKKEEVSKPGTYSITWDGSDDNGNKVPKGIYFYRLSVGEKKTIKKIIKLD